MVHSDCGGRNCLLPWRVDVASSASGRNEANALRQQQIDRLKAFSAAKLKQSQMLAAAAGEKISPEFQRFFDAATNGDWQTVTNMYESFQSTSPAI